MHILGALNNHAHYNVSVQKILRKFLQMCAYVKKNDKTAVFLFLILSSFFNEQLYCDMNVFN